MLMNMEKTLESIPIPIEDLSNNITRKVFYNDALVTYRTFLYKPNKARKILRAYLIDMKDEMTITLFVLTQLIDQQNQKILLNFGIYITHFQIIPKKI